ncbi:MAG TPA: NUDIX hydrolase [Candidatus Binatia bacterium]
MRTVREISSGGVIFRTRNAGVEVALIRVRGRWGLPKGKVEEGEGLEETALREVREETGLEGKIVAKLGDITYWYSNKTRAGEPVRIFKRVYFYLLRFLAGDVSRHDQEVEEVCWFPIEEAQRQISYRTERDILNKAKGTIDEKGSRPPPARTRRARGG